MTFWHEGVRVTHPRLHAAFLRGVRFLDDEGCFAVQVGHFRGQIEVEDTPFWVVAYACESGAIQLTDKSHEPLAAETLTVDADEVLRCTVKGRFPARFTRAGQAHLLDALEPGADGWLLRAGSARLRVPGLAADP